jgi:hypothetical protein
MTPVVESECYLSSMSRVDLIRSTGVSQESAWTASTLFHNVAGSVAQVDQVS